MVLGNMQINLFFLHILGMWDKRKDKKLWINLTRTAS